MLYAAVDSKNWLALVKSGVFCTKAILREHYLDNIVQKCADHQ